MMKTRRPKGGFTLVELMIVIIIIVLVAGGSIALVGNYMRNESVRQGGYVVMQALTQAKQLAAEKRIMHFVVFENKDEVSSVKIYQDAGNPPNKEYDQGSDLEIPGRPYLLPKFVSFKGPFCPEWIGIEPNGYCIFSVNAINPPGGGFTEAQASQFEATLRSEQIAGDIVLEVKDRPFRMCMDIDRASGKIRRFHMLQVQQ